MENLKFQQPLLQSLETHDSSEIILNMLIFVTKKHLLFIIILHLTTKQQHLFEMFSF